MLHPVVQQLLVVQEIDRRLIQLRREQKDIPARKSLIEARLKAHRESLKAAQDDIKKTTASMKQLDVEIESTKQKIQRFREQEMQIKTNEEYRALEHEIAVAQERIRSLEDQELALMEKLEELKNVVIQREKDLQLEERRVQEDQSLLDKRAASVEEEIKKLEAERLEAAKGLDVTWLGRYERVLKRWGDFAVVPIENHACGGCHMQLPPQIIQDAKRGDTVVVCSFCNRLLYLA